MNEPMSDDLPWTESQWEAFMTRQDIRSAKYGELLETFMDHPDSEEIIAREMGWLEEEEESDPERDAERIEAMNRAAAEYDALSDEELARMQQKEHDELAAIPAYAAGFRYGVRVHKAITPYMEGVTPGEEIDEQLAIAVRDSMVVAAKIAGGHGMGYHDEVLCGNIVRCKIALQAANNCLSALQSLSDLGHVPTDVTKPLIEEGSVLRDLVTERIAELRRRVWWESR